MVSSLIVYELQQKIIYFQEQEVYANLLTKLTLEERVILDLRQQLLEAKVSEAKKQVEVTEAKKQVEVLQVQLNATEKTFGKLM
jgi:hypothetical protein